MLGAYREAEDPDQGTQYTTRHLIRQLSLVSDVISAMTAVNWERLTGGEVEELVAALILRGRAEGNRITASRGDRGIDIRVQDGESWEIYQVKKYCAALTSRQAHDIKSSWETFVEQTIPTLRVSAWHLVMPWDPTNERLEWLESLTAGHSIQTSWIGRSQLDYLAAGHPQLVDYFQGNGAERIQHLISAALLAGSTPAPTDDSSGALLSQVKDRHFALASVLDEIDPFYQYEISIKSGHPPSTLPDIDAVADTALVAYHLIDNDRYMIIRIIPRDTLSILIRPITHTFEFETTEPRHKKMLEEFRRYGSPLADIPAVTTKSEGPPGTTAPTGTESLISTFVLPANDIPDLELRLQEERSEAKLILPLIDVEVSTGLDGSGMRIAASDPSRSLRAEFLLSRNPDFPSVFTLQTFSLVGKPARTVLDVVTFVAAAENNGATVDLAIAGGLPISPGWKVGEFPVAESKTWSSVIHNLVEIQKHTHTVVRVPQTVSAVTITEIQRIAELLRGKIRPYGSDRVGLTLTTGAAINSGQIAVVFHQEIKIQLEDQEILTDHYLQVYSPKAHFEANPSDDDSPLHGFIIFDTPATERAIDSIPEQRP